LVVGLAAGISVTTLFCVGVHGHGWLMPWYVCRCCLQGWVDCEPGLTGC
jgi:hypothetical protein